MKEVIGVKFRLYLMHTAIKEGREVESLYEKNG